MHKLIAPSILAVSLLATAAQAAGPDKLSIAVYGDSPYGRATMTSSSSLQPRRSSGRSTRIPTLLVFHVGDIHSGSQQCTLEYDQSIYNAWNGLQPVAASGLPKCSSTRPPSVFR